jgi:hypothetical protein
MTTAKNKPSAQGNRVNKFAMTRERLMLRFSPDKGRTGGVDSAEIGLSNMIDRPNPPHSPLVRGEAGKSRRHGLVHPIALTIRRDWLAKTLAGVLLGFTLAVGCSGLLNWLVADLPLSGRGQLIMWMIAPVWMGALAGVYFFRSGVRAWGWLAAANLLVFGILALCR